MKKIIAGLTIFVLLLYLPILVKPPLLFDRSNDLHEFFWPIFFYTKNQILNTHQIPFWNTMFLSGTPLLPDPQAPIFYLPNIIFLILPINAAFLVSFMLHTLWGGIGAYLIGRKVLKFDSTLSLIAGIFYILMPRMSGFIEAGHVGLIFATAWIPYTFLSVYKIATERKIKWSIFFAISLSGIFYTHPTTFVLCAFISGVVLFFFLSKTFKNTFVSIYYFLAGAVLNFGLIAIAFLPQLAWVPSTNRFLLATDRDVWPKWKSLFEYFKAISNPILWNHDYAVNLDTEKWIASGVFILLLSILGLLKLYKSDKRKALGVFALGSIIAILGANNVSPFYDILLDRNWYVFARVTTRSWFVISMITVYLSVYFLHSVKNKKIRYTLVALAIIEVLFINWTKISTPIDTSREVAPKGVYEFIKQDKDVFRIFCTTRCFTQQDVALYNLQTIEGYSTLHQKNYYQHAWQLTGAYWNYYTLTLPPIGSYKHGELNPDYKALGEYNTKYIVSPYEIKNDSLEKVREISGYFIYVNKYFYPRVYVYEGENISPIEITKYSPNEITVNTENLVANTNIRFSEVYSDGWVSVDDRSTALEVQETPNAQRQVSMANNSKFIVLSYKPKNYQIGMLITLTTVLSLIFLWTKSRKIIYSLVFFLSQFFLPKV